MKNQERLGELLEEIKELAGEDLYLHGADGRILASTKDPRSELLRKAAAGELSPEDVSAGARQLGWEAPGAMFLLIMDPGRLLGDVAVEAARALFEKDLLAETRIDAGERTSGSEKLLFLIHASEWEDPVEAASLLQTSLEVETVTDVRIGTSQVFDSFSSLSLAFRHAGMALKTLEIFSQKEKVASWRHLGLQLAALRLPEADVSDYLDSVLGEGAGQIFSDSELMRTAEVFLMTGLNSAETARQLCVHRNTLNYRLDKIERTTGLDLKRFEDAAAFRLASLVWQRKE